MAGVKPYTHDDWKKTNADRIRSMTDEELAKFMNNVQATAYNSGLLEMKIQGFPAKKDAWLEWLKEEVTANDS